MKFTLSWLRRHLDTSAAVAEIADALTDLGLEVEAVEDRAARLRDFTIGRVVVAEKHPDADRLKVCQVETDEGRRQIICGAPNAREGITVVIAKPGVYVPGIDTTIGVGTIRGIESFGMMASERELGLSDEHDGIIELPSGEVGQPFADWLAANDPAKVDPVIDIAVTPNRPDALGVRGIARDLAARGLGTLRPLGTPRVAETFDCPVPVAIDDDTRDGCPVFCLRMIRGVTNGPSPQWLQDALRAIGLRPISFLVDVTNWFTHDLNRPAPRLRRGRGARRAARPPRGGRGNARGARRPDLCAPRKRDGHLRRRGDREHRRHHGRFGVGRVRCDRRRAGGERLVGSGADRDDGPGAAHQFRCPLPLRARRGPRLHAGRAGSRHRDDPRHRGRGGVADGRRGARFPTPIAPTGSIRTGSSPSSAWRSRPTRSARR